MKKISIRAPSVDKNSLPLSPRLAAASNHTSTSRTVFSLQPVSKLAWATITDHQWTYYDQKRLNSIDSLVSRGLEYHNLNHSFRTIDKLLEGQLGTASEEAVDFVFLGTDVPVGKPSSMQVPLSELKMFLNDVLGSYGSRLGVSWLHIRDLRALGLISKHFDMDYICHAGFYDLRSHSNAHATHDSLFMTLCTVCKPYEESFHLYKLYMFAKRGLCVTFERELLSDLTHNAEPIGDLIWSSLHNRIDRLAQRCSTMGSLHFMYEAAKDMLDLSDGVLEFFSRATAYLSVQMNKDLSFQQLVNTHRTVHILRSSILLLDRQIAESYSFFSGFVDTWSLAYDQITQSVMRADNLPYLLDVTDSYRYRSETLRCINDEQLSVILETLTALRNLKSIKTNIDLTLIATVFLPLTFIASIYGMNFQKDGDSTITLLNYHYGPEVFFAMCAAVLIVNFVFFLRSGYINWETTYNWIVEDEATQQSAALLEEKRRHTESRLYRNAAVLGGLDSFNFSVDSARSILKPKFLSVDAATTRSPMVPPSAADVERDSEILRRGAMSM